MSKRTVTRWAQRQYAGDVQPWPRWVRWTLGVGALVIVLAKVAGWV